MKILMLSSIYLEKDCPRRGFDTTTVWLWAGRYPPRPRRICWKNADIQVLCTGRVNEAAAAPAGRAWHCFRRLRRRKRRHARPAGAAAASLTVVSASALKWLLSRRPRSKQRDGTLSTTNLGQKLKKKICFCYFLLNKTIVSINRV